MNTIEKLQYDMGQWYETSSISQFMRWWTTHLKSFVPEKYQNNIFAQSIDVFIAPTDDGIEVWSQTGEDLSLLTNTKEDGEKEQWWHQVQHIINQADGRQVNVKYVIPNKDVLVRKIALPQAAKENLDEVIGFELDKYVPFKADQVRMSYIIDKKNSTHDNLLLELAVLPQTKLTEILNQCQEKSIALNSLDVNTNQAPLHPNGLGVNLLPHENRKARDNSKIKINLGLFLLLMALVYFVMYTSLANKQDKVDRLTEMNSQLQKQARTSKLLKKELKEVIVSSQFLQNQKQASPDLVTILSEITAILPDHTYISKFRISQDTLEITGQSGNANSLVPKLDKSTQWYVPHVVGGITPDSRTKKEKFTIKADLKEPKAEDDDVNNS